MNRHAPALFQLHVNRTGQEDVAQPASSRRLLRPARLRRRRFTAWLWLCCALILAVLALSIPGQMPAARAANGKAADSEAFYLAGGDLVFVTKTGHCYHCIPDCHNTKTSFPIAAREAVRLGYDACGNCNPGVFSFYDDSFVLPDDEPIVYLVVQDEKYHSNPDCKAIHDQNGKYAPVAATLSEAKHLQKEPCKKCKPPA